MDMAYLKWLVSGRHHAPWLVYLFSLHQDRISPTLFYHQVAGASNGNHWGLCSAPSHLLPVSSPAYMLSYHFYQHQPLKDKHITESTYISISICHWCQVQHWWLVIMIELFCVVYLFSLPNASDRRLSSSSIWFLSLTCCSKASKSTCKVKRFLAWDVVTHSLECQVKENVSNKTKE